MIEANLGLAHALCLQPSCVIPGSMLAPIGTVRQPLPRRTEQRHRKAAVGTRLDLWPGRAARVGGGAMAGIRRRALGCTYDAATPRALRAPSLSPGHALVGACAPPSMHHSTSCNRVPAATPRRSSRACMHRRDRAVRAPGTLARRSREHPGGRVRAPARDEGRGGGRGQVGGEASRPVRSHHSCMSKLQCTFLAMAPVAHHTPHTTTPRARRQRAHTVHMLLLPDER